MAAAAAASTVTPHRAGRQVAVGVLVLAAHAALFWLWPRTTPLERRLPGARSVAVTTVPITPPPPPAVPTPAVAPPLPHPTEPPARMATPRAPGRLPAPVEPAAPAVGPITAPPPAVAAAPPEPAASALDLRLRLAPGQTQRGGLTESPGSARAQALNDPRSNVQADPRQQLPDAVAAAGKGDCLKGEYAGGGMGLLSLPFLAYHAATGNCRR